MFLVQFLKCKILTLKFLLKTKFSFSLQRQLNNALQQAGIYTINITIFGFDEAVDTLRQVYLLPRIYFQHQNGTWLDSPLYLNSQLYQILLSNQLQRLTTHVYRLSEAFAYFYQNSLSDNDRDYLQRLILNLYNQQSSSINHSIENLSSSFSVYSGSITSNTATVLFEESYLNLTSSSYIQRAYVFLFYNDQELDGRYTSSITLSSALFSGPYYLQIPLTFISNYVPTSVVKQRYIQQVTFTGKPSRTIVQTALNDYWQIPTRLGLTNSNVYVITFKQYLVYSLQ